jgi:hypothetical protein
MTTGKIDVEALVKEVAELPNPATNLLSHNERELIGVCNRLADALAVMKKQALDNEENLKEEINTSNKTIDGIREINSRNVAHINGLNRQIQKTIDLLKEIIACANLDTPEGRIYTVKKMRDLAETALKELRKTPLGFVKEPTP